ncbi:hypothetical protein ABE288_21300 [Bacillus salipaludis]|uniref:hypothetical protein n=1 Tax=Bacillus salipaludis TaxID=2547811 RepID=UPI003D212C3D
MEIKLSRKIFNSLEDSQLVRACFDPLIPLIRGKSNKVKEEVYNQLTTEQKKLFIFNAFYNHACNSLAEFYWWSAFYLVQPKIWSELKSALRHFKTDEMLGILLEMEKVTKAQNNPIELEKFDVSYNDLYHNPELYSFVSPLFKKFVDVTQTTLNLIGKAIRNNPTAFILFEE